MQIFKPARQYKAPQTRAIADVLHPLMRQVTHERGFALVQIMMNWEAIAGERIGNLCQPAKLTFAKRAKNYDEDKMPEPATLTLRVEKAASLEIQHMGDMILTRINSHFGWPMVGKIVLKPGTLKKREKPARFVAKPVEPLAKIRAGVVVGDVKDEALRAALVKLGARVLGK